MKQGVFCRACMRTHATSHHDALHHQHAARGTERVYGTCRNTFEEDVFPAPHKADCAKTARLANACRAPGGASCGTANGANGTSVAVRITRDADGRACAFRHATKGIVDPPGRQCPPDTLRLPRRSERSFTRDAAGCTCAMPKRIHASTGWAWKSAREQPDGLACHVQREPKQCPETTTAPHAVPSRLFGGVEGVSLRLPAVRRSRPVRACR